MADKKQQLHIVMFPWLAFGHIIPFLELSKSIAQKGHKISFISTPRNIDRLPKIPPNLASSFTLVKIPLPKVQGLPENAESTMDVGHEDPGLLKKAYDGMEADVARFLRDSCADALIYDFAGFWVSSAAMDLGIPRFFFCIFPTWFLAFLGTTQDLIHEFKDRKSPEDFTSPPKWVPFDTKVAFKYYEAKLIVGAGEKDSSGFSEAYRAGIGISQSDALLIRHCHEFETDWFDLLSNLYQKPIIPLGHLPPHFQETDNHEFDHNWVSIKQWLDTKTKGSVVYIALGSEATPSQDQLTELAHGLELSRLPFFWAFRKAATSTVKLPDGFEERIIRAGQGMVWKGWVPQLKILRHDSIGGFLTHSGWSSVVEALMLGVPLILLPIMADQWLNARVLDEKEMGLEVARNEENGSISRESVAKAVTRVMVEEEGKKFRDKAKETMAHAFGDRGIHDRYVQHFIDHLLQKSII
ncbi:UDP-glycosyltransferase 91C1-like [Henckelia pumila]|uniref:UDP-glycosyltransferase 91C1-like n=1 Tax=Henckelia pumila TaxID=405737 RepID=UPI003C6E2B55